MKNTLKMFFSLVAQEGGYLLINSGYKQPAYMFEPKNVSLTFLINFFWKIERAKSGRASPEKEALMANEL